MKTKASSIGNGGIRLYLPKKIVEKLNIKEGDEIGFELKKDKAIIKKIK